MAISYGDKKFLANDVSFQDRVRQSMVAACVAIKNEATTTSFHRERETYLVGIMNSPDTYKVLFATATANSSDVISDATGAGTVVLTLTNVSTAGSQVTDAHLDTAISGLFNSFFRTPAS